MYDPFSFLIAPLPLDQVPLFQLCRMVFHTCKRPAKFFRKFLLRDIRMCSQKIQQLPFLFRKLHFCSVCFCCILDSLVCSLVCLVCLVGRLVCVWSVHSRTYTFSIKIDAQTDPHIDKLRLIQSVFLHALHQFRNAASPCFDHVHIQERLRQCTISDLRVPLFHAFCRHPPASVRPAT